MRSQFSAHYYYVEAHEANDAVPWLVAQLDSAILTNKVLP
jgi:hypothetical protein